VSYGFTPLRRAGSGPPLVCLHGFTDTWRTWELVLPELERHHDVLALTLAGHAGGPPIGQALSDAVIADEIERAMDDAGFTTAHIVGNSLGGYLSLKMAERGRARTVVALAPAGGWAEDNCSFVETLDFFAEMRELVQAAAPRAEEILSTPTGRRRATMATTMNYKHIPTELLAHQMRGAAECDATLPLVAYAREVGWHLDPELVTCPVRIVWGTEDKLLPWPAAAYRYRERWLPHADWVELEGIGHCPQLDIPLETAQLIVGFTDRRVG
jgi:pimeloyl-ACP methyl ester carboxylesterase